MAETHGSEQSRSGQAIDTFTIHEATMQIFFHCSLYVIGYFFVASALIIFPLTVHAAEHEQQKVLVVYFSKTNNTRTVAQHIQSLTGGDMLELKTVRQYPENHDETVKIAVQERRSDARPELSTVFPTNIEDYDVIFVGYPVWEYTMPMAFFTFFDKYKFHGKTIIPFSTHRGSRLGGGPEDIAKLCPQAKVLKGLAIHGADVASSRGEVTRWLQQLGMADS